MTTKEYLSQVRIIDKRINRKTDEVNRLKQLAVSIGLDMTKERVQTSGSKDRVGNSAASIVDAQNDAMRYIDDCIRLRTTIVNQINSLDKPIYSDILYLRFIKGMKHKDIAEELSYSLIHIRHMQTEALTAFEDRFGGLYLKTRK